MQSVHNIAELGIGVDRSKTKSCHMTAGHSMIHSGNEILYNGGRRSICVSIGHAFTCPVVDSWVSWPWHLLNVITR
eukprot:scaffold149236_cov21-Prasinocladus_malaysianus.AAC.2